MAETVAPHWPAGPAPAWLDDAAMAVYAGEYGRTGFQGGLNWYRGRTTGRFAAQESLFAGVAIRVPALFLGGVADWGVFQFPGALEAMRQRAFAAMRKVQLVEGAGHWVQQEQPEAVVRLVLEFLAGR
jgi:pimeloyl-ACP methyl ester carboxylesterase